jgi:hypothetical protein
LDSDAGAKASALTLSGELKLRREQGGSSASAAVTERRTKPRIRRAFPTRVRGLDSEGRSFDLDVGLENISSGGVYLRIPRALKSGDELNLVVRFSNGHQGATAALIGSVVRVEPGLDGLHGIAIAIQRYEFI